MTVLTTLARSLEQFFPGLTDHFMCPTCLRRIPLCNRDEISEAHIIPRAAGGRAKTYLCTRCNSQFGAQQDKWFGEFVRLASEPKPWVLSTAIKDGYFFIDGQRVNGHWGMDGDRHLVFYSDDRRNSPKVNRFLDERFAGPPSRIKLTVSLPILSNDNLIKVGFLMCGYLMWFATFGYSWVLQKHLDIVRRQILQPSVDLIGTNYIATHDMNTAKPWIAFLPLSTGPVNAFGLLKNIVIFPPRHRPHLYATLGTFSETTETSKIRCLKTIRKPLYGPPTIVLQDEHLMIAPDLVGNICTPPLALKFCDDADQPKVLRPVSREEWDHLAKQPGTGIYHHNLND